MTVYDEETHIELSGYDLNEGCILEREKIVHHDYLPAQPEQAHYERVVDRDFTKVVDVPAQPEREAYDEKVIEYIYHQFTDDEKEENEKNKIRKARDTECFPVVNRGYAWYCLLSYEQLNELKSWYKAWLDAPDTKVIPQAPAWINEKITDTEEII